MALPVKITFIRLGVMVAKVFFVGVMPGRISEGPEVGWNVRGKSFPAGMLLVVGRGVHVSSFG